MTKINNSFQTHLFFFHPSHSKKNSASILVNIVLTILTAGLWQIPFWCIKLKEEKKFKKLTPEETPKIDSLMKKEETWLQKAEKAVAHIAKPTFDLQLPERDQLPSFTEDLPALTPAHKVSENEIEVTFGKTKVVLKKGSTVTEDTEAVVNAANGKLMGGGGIDGEFWSQSGALKGAPGDEDRDFLEAEMFPILDKIKKTTQGSSLPDGGAVMTRSVNIKSPYIIHAVGPKGEHPEELMLAYQSCLQILHKNNLKTISICCISQSIFGYDVKDAAPIVIKFLRAYLEKHPEVAPQEIRLMMFTDKEWKTYSSLPEFK